MAHRLSEQQKVTTAYNPIKCIYYNTQQNLNFLNPS